MNLRNMAIFIVFAVFIITSACGTAAQNNGNGLESESTKTNGQEVVNEQTEKQSVENETVENHQDSLENTAFRNIEISGEKGHYNVKGEARVFEGVFFYAVEEGHNYLIEETKVEVPQGAPSWESFELNISIPEEDLPINGTVTLTLYEYSAKDNTTINSYHVKLEQIQS